MFHANLSGRSGPHFRMLSRFRSVALFAALAFGVCAGAAARMPGEREPDIYECGSLSNHFGPFDYRNQRRGLSIVERAHFSPNIEGLVTGNTGSLGGEIGYTLRAYPNHPRALMAMVRLAFRDRTETPTNAKFSVECYLKRAELFRPDDWEVKSIYGAFLLRAGRVEEAIEYFERSEEMSGGESLSLQYNLGLAYLKASKYEQALEKAHLVYSRGFQLPGLRNGLKRAGRWSDRKVER